MFTSFSKVSIEQKVSKVNLILQNSVDKVSIRCYYGGVRCRTDTKKITRIHLRHTREVENAESKKRLLRNRGSHDGFFPQRAYVSALVDNAELAERLYGIMRRELQSYKRENRDCTYMVEMDRCAKEKNKEVN